MSSKGNRVKWKCLTTTCMSEFVYWDAQKCARKRKCPACGGKDYMTMNGYEALRVNGGLDEYGNVKVNV